jgi:hypothetical protein
MRRLVDQRGELLSLRLAGQKGDLAIVADTQSRGDLLVELQRDVLPREKSSIRSRYFIQTGRIGVLPDWQFEKKRL